MNIVLATDFQAIHSGLFTIEDFMETESLVFNFKESDMLLNSTYYMYVSDDFAPCARGHGEKIRKYITPIGEKSYIFVEIGETGFDYRLEFYSCESERSGDVCKVTIKEVHNKDIIDAIAKVFWNTEYGAMTIFNERILCKIFSKKKFSVQEIIDVYDKTAFINTNLIQKHKVTINIEENHRHYSFMDNIVLKIPGCSKDYPVKNLTIQDTNTDEDHNRIRLIDSRDLSIGTYLLNDGKNTLHNTFEILKVESIVHDLYGNIHAIAKIDYVYPMDREEIMVKFPSLVKNLQSPFLRREDLMFLPCDCESSYKVVSMPYISTDATIGDAVIYVKLNMYDRHLGLFNNDLAFFKLPQHRSLMDDAKDIAIYGERLFSLVQIDNSLHIFVYKLSSIIKCGDEFFGNLSFLKEYLLDAKVRRGELYVVSYAKYLLFRGRIKPRELSRDSYLKLMREVNDEKH